MQIVVNGLLTTYTTEGTGKNKVVLLLHGWGDTHKTFLSLVEYLKNEYMVVALDLPGFGGTQAPPTAWTLSDYARFVQQFCKKISESPTVLIGHSNGGAIALRSISMRLFHVDKLILIASSGIRGEYKGRNKVLRIMTKTGKLFTMLLPLSAKRRIRQKVYSTIGSDMLVAEHLQETFKNIVSDDVRDDAKTVNCATLLIYGDEDHATPVVWGSKIHELITGSRMEVIKGSGHFVHHDAAEQVNGLIKDFIA